MNATWNHMDHTDMIIISNHAAIQSPLNKSQFN